MVHRLKSWASTCGEALHLIYCWEWQKRGALHLHLAAWFPSPDARARLHRGLRGEWIRLLLAVNERSGVDLFARAGGRGTWLDCLDKVRARAEWVRKSVAKYLGKYLSKTIPAGSESRRFFYPSRWWGSTSNLKRQERSSRWSSEYFYPCYGSACGDMNELLPILQNASSWYATYTTRVVRGLVAVLSDVTPEFLVYVTKTLKAGKNTMAKEPLEEKLIEFYRLLDLIRRVKPRWFRTLSNASDCVNKVEKLMDKDESVVLDPERIPVIVYSAAAALEHYVKLNPGWGGEWLTKAMAASSIKTARQVQSTLMALWDERYIHIVDEEIEVRARHDFL